MLLKRVFLAPADATTPSMPSAPSESSPAPAPSPAPAAPAPSPTPAAPAPSPTPAAPAPSQAPTPSPASTAPTPSPEAPSQSAPTTDDLKEQVAALHSELQIWKLRSSMSERHIVPQDFDLVSRLILESSSTSGKSIDQCVSDLYSSKPYLFKIPKEQTKTVENKSQEVDNKRLIEGAIARLGRAKISL